eukprot:6481096-Amphidinium_carterae.1
MPPACNVSIVDDRRVRLKRSTTSLSSNDKTAANSKKNNEVRRAGFLAPEVRRTDPASVPTDGGTIGG